MSKKVYAGADIIFDNRKVFRVSVERGDDIGLSSILLANTGINDANYMYEYKGYGQYSTFRPTYRPYGASGDTDLTVPPSINYGTSVRVTITDEHGSLYILNSREVDIPDFLYDLLWANKPVGTEPLLNAYSNTDGVEQDVVEFRINAHFSNQSASPVYPTTIIENLGYSEIVGELNKTRRSVYVLTTQENVSYKMYLKWFGTETPIMERSYNSTNYPHKPILEKIVRDGVVSVRVTTNVPAHGNIYFNGGAEPTYTYTTSRIAPYTAEIEINQAGTYTANIISEVVIENQHYFAYGELSDTLIVETQNVECTLSFNEYTGVISCIPNIEGSAEKFTLQKQSGSEWINISENTIGEFHITEGGTYKIIPTFGIFFTGTVFPESITVIATLNTPVAYSDPAFPSQLGFDEVENANMYDIYRVNEDGDDELVATISQNNIISRIMRKEKMFIVIPNDEVKNV